MICLKCKNEIESADVCPHCGADVKFERQKQLAVQTRLSTKSAASKRLTSQQIAIPFFVNIAMGIACLMIAILLLNLLIVGSSSEEVFTAHPWLNVISLLLLVPVVYLLVANIFSAKATFDLWKGKGSKDASKTSASCMYMVSLKLINTVFWVVATLLALVVSLVLTTSPAAFNKLDSFDDLCFISAKEDGNKTVYTRGETFAEFVDNSINDGDSYYVAIENAFEKVADTAETHIIIPESDEYNKLSNSEKIDASANYNRYGVHIVRARELLADANIEGMTGLNLWLGSTLDLFGAGTHRDVADFARDSSNTLLAWIIAILAPLFCGASFYFIPKAFKQSILYYDKLHKANNEGLYNKETSTPSILLFIFGGVYILLSALSLYLTVNFDLISTVAQDATLITSAIGHIGLFLLLLAIGTVMICNGVYYSVSHKKIVSAIAAAEAEYGF